ncbi:hypothetical protein EMIT091MI3_70088 [Kosakonia quasisacchari]
MGCGFNIGGGRNWTIKKDTVEYVFTAIAKQAALYFSANKIKLSEYIL